MKKPHYTKLNLGSGIDKKEGYVNVDWTALVEPDVVCDLNSFPYPFPDNSFDWIEASHVLEHLDRPFEVMREIHRLLKPGGKALIKVPHFSRGFSHAEHAHGFDISFPYYFDKRYIRWGYFGVDLGLEHMKLRWLAFFHLMETMGYGTITLGVLRGLNAVISWLANISPAFTSRIWCFWVGGFDEIEFLFVKAK